ncbi:Ribokinase [Frankia canadensis]|uniref:Ribokinase n=1 Tax=Frankia canadensis TaxID=1836972 RepID=A0A2I2KSW8_9ACTN|nr:ribokinase [Frankia canadensis]SNQ48767.1 Ribokinase [Frankia canadensis]SOU56057.1 Ribokinase [Frankia canadensis]
MGRVVVVGSTNMDVTTRVDRIPQPGETVAGSAVVFTPGGRGANQAVAASRLGAPTVLVGAVGSDGFGAVLHEFLRGEAIDVTCLVRLDSVTGTAVTMVDDAGENVIAIVPGANTAVSAAALDGLGLGPDDVVLLQQEIPASANAQALSRARAAGARTVLNAAPHRPMAADPLAADVRAAVDVLVVNEHELAGLVPEAAGLPHLAATAAVAAVRGLLADGAGPTADIVVTLGGAGTCARIGDAVVTLAAPQVPVVDTTGAGDCFCGAFGAGLAAGLPAATALFHANLAASLAVQRPGAGAAMPTRAELDALLTGRVGS